MDDMPECINSPFTSVTAEGWVDMKDVVIGPQIGAGEFSKVYIGSYFGDLVAIKKQSRVLEGLETYLLRELTILRKLRESDQKYFVTFVGAHNETALNDGQYSLYILTEYCQGGDLLSLLLENGIKGLGWKFRTKLALDASLALHHLHEKNFIHRDVKSEVQ
jgi:serine/threonine protein kinase